MKTLHCILIIAIFCLLGYPVSAEYRTPDLGTIYSLDELVSISGDTLLKVGSDYLLYDRLVISPSDELQIAGERILVVTRGLPVGERRGNPSLIIEGRLEASNVSMESIPGVSRSDAGYGLVISGHGHEGLASAILTNCTFECLLGGISARAGGIASVTDSHFPGNFVSGANAYMGGILKLNNCTLEGYVVSARSEIRMENCQITGGGITLQSTPPETLISGCIVEGTRGVGLYIHGASLGLATGCEFSGFDTGLYFSKADSPFRVENCVFHENQESEIVFDSDSVPILRGNEIHHDVGSVTDSLGILVLENAQPDLGTTEDPGRNIIRGDADSLVYHAGTENVYAIGNDWGLLSNQEIEALIYHQKDDAADDDESEFLSGWFVTDVAVPVAGLMMMLY